MFTQDSVQNLVDDGGKFVNNSNGMNLNWGMYTVADILTLLEWHIEYSPTTRREAKHLHKYLNYHGVALSAYFYDEAFDSDSLTYPNQGAVIRTNIAQASTGYEITNKQDLKAEQHYCERTCHWLNRALTFLYNNPTPIVGGFSYVD